ncbi:actin-like ATPase domain-containing protein [Zopfia rhizophila CBS 207.26]|uniref:Actin-like ATPase domain-containing protein n=1 Tax=Zopfia rhizophila CBS 207.26 TaxID=1314779 RepID=A0A6A6DAB7_9PEZI|nr:actin-like ATPase domain-containing protein [Zopfia rhizophila CBS 207.26]
MGIKGRKRHHLIIGLDFGTTYTGVAYALSGKRRISTINKWPGSEPRSLENEKQAPSILAYEDGQVFWGYQVKPEMRNRYSFMKLHLDKNAPPATYDKPNHEDNLENGYFRLPKEKEIEVVTREYLIKVLTYTREFLEGELGKFVMESTRIEFWITKPTASGDQAQLMVAKLAKEAVIQAGFAEDVARRAGFADNGAENFFGLVEESVAAVTANLLETTLSPEDEIKTGSKMLVCDCGGGQVDIAVYKVAKIEPTLELEQVTVAQGPKVGAAHIDRKLHELMKKDNEEFGKLGSEKEIGSHFMKDFEKHKREFGGESSNTLKKSKTLRLGMRNAKKSKFYKTDGRVVLKEEQIKWMFKSTVRQIVASLKEQIEDANKLSRGRIRDLALVGGLGDSPYLRSILQKWCSENGVRLRTLEDSWGAVARGAVAYGLGLVKLTKRLTQNHYGIKCRKKFLKDSDHEDDKVEVGYRPYTLCRNCVDWIVEMGKDTTTPFKTGSYRHNITEGVMSFTVEIYCSKAKEPPRKCTDDTNRTNRIEIKLSSDDVARADDVNGYILFPFQVHVLLGEREGTVVFQPRSGNRILASAVVNFMPLN